MDHYSDYYPGKGLLEAEELAEPYMVDNPAVLELKKEKASLTAKLIEVE